MLKLTVSLVITQRQGSLLVNSKKYIKGFTLSELLLAVAILLILAGMAIPSVAVAQKNMHLVELDSAAEQIASAAQNQITAMKVSGTWIALLDETGNKDVYADQKATGLPPDVKNAEDIYYFTSQQARDNGVLPSLSIDDVVRDGDYVIEYSKSTATVCGVFYSDRKTGFFSELITGGVPAQKYYQDSDSPLKREEESLRGADSLIGYYWGTPAAATKEVSLENPVIWINEEGNLCTQNTNLTDSLRKDWKTELEITIFHIDAQGKPDPASSFVISGLQGEGLLTYTLSLGDRSVTESFSNQNKSKIYELVPRAAPTDASDVFQIDLNALLKVLASSGKNELVEVGKSFAVGSDISIEAKVITPNKPCVPATARANMQWPKVLEKLQVFVTDPHIDDTKTVGGASANAFVKPGFVLKDIYADFAGDAQDIFEIKSDTSTLLEGVGDGEATRQAYIGKWVGLSRAQDSIAAGKDPAVEVTAGVYKGKTGASIDRKYQIYEIWINEQLVGSLSNGIWQWYYAVDFLDMPQNTAADPATSITIRPDIEALQKTGIPADEEGGYSLYVRTAPSLKDIQEVLLDSCISNNGYVAGMPPNTVVSGRDSSDEAWIIQDLLASKLGFSSSVALWTAKKTNILEATGHGFSGDDIYITYAPTPFKPQDITPTQGNSLTSSVLWRYAKANKKYTQDPYVAFGQNFTGDPRLLSMEKATVSQPQILQQGSIDFAIPATTDYLFYRTISYYNSDQYGSGLLDLPRQWVPYYGFDIGTKTDNASAVLATAPNKLSEEPFAFWNDKKDGTGGDYAGGSPIIAAANTLALFQVDLYARYKKPGPGMMYLEFSDKEQKNMSSYYGYLDDTQVKPFADGLQKQNGIAAWGYFVLVPEGRAKPAPVEGSPALGNKSGTVTVKKKNFDIYPLSTGINRNSTQTLAYASGGTPAAYKVNVNFAAAVARGNQEVAWGSTESPWRVRHATQFPGALPWYGDGPQQRYVADAFLQEHDIDMSVIPAEGDHKFNSVFTGAYDGSTYQIKNFRFRLINEVNHQMGLFPATKGATLKNISMADDSGATWAITPTFNPSTGIPNNVNILFGGLVGVADDTRISNCSISRGGSSKNLDIEISQVSASVGSVCGGLVGQALGSSYIENSAASGIDISIDPSEKTWNSTVACGGIVAVLDTATIVRSSVRNMSFETNTPARGSLSFNFGGLVGSATVGTTGLDASINGCQVKDISFGAPALQPRERIFAGGCVGLMQGNLPLTNSAFQQALLAAEGKEETLKLAIGKKQ